MQYENEGIRVVKKLKVFLSLGILICLFLPLSQCSSVPAAIKSKSLIASSQSEEFKSSLGVATKSPIVRLYSLPDNLGDWAILCAFVLPLLVCFISSKNFILSFLFLSFQTVVVAWLGYVIFILVYSLGSPLYGGYILTIFYSAYCGYTIFEWYSKIYLAQKAKNIFK
jgi:hypothetical protein